MRDTNRSFLLAWWVGVLVVVDGVASPRADVIGTAMMTGEGSSGPRALARCLGQI